MNYKFVSNLSLHISHNSNNLTPMEKKMLQDLLKKRSDFTFDCFTIAHVAEQLNVSTTSLHRLSKKLGYNSFALMKEDYFAKNESIDEENEDHSYQTMISNTYRLVKRDIHQDMLESLAKAQRITIYGMGMSRYISKIFEIKLQLGGFFVQSYDDSRYMKISSQSLEEEKDIVIVLSRSGCPPELIGAMFEVNKRKVQSILITETNSSPIESMATYVVHTSYALDNDSDIDTRINTHIALDMLTSELLNYKKGLKENEE